MPERDGKNKGGKRFTFLEGKINEFGLVSVMKFSGKKMKKKTTLRMLCTFITLVCHFFLKVFYDSKLKKHQSITLRIKYSIEREFFVTPEGKSDWKS